jgi:hypothetical protein
MKQGFNVKLKTKKRKDGRLEMKRSDLPIFPEARDKMPAPIEHEGRRKLWVGIGYIDEGPATGKEPLVLIDD